MVLLHMQNGEANHLLFSRGVRPASGVPGECFSLKDRVDDAVDPTDEDDFVFEVTEEELEAEEEDGDGDYDGGE